MYTALMVTGEDDGKETVPLIQLDRTYLQVYRPSALTILWRRLRKLGMVRADTLEDNILNEENRVRLSQTSYIIIIIL